MSKPGEWPPQPGLHLAEWSCELLGTALLLLGGLSAVCLDFGPHSPLRGLASSVRLLLTGLLFAGTGSLLAISPLGGAAARTSTPSSRWRSGLSARCTRMTWLATLARSCWARSWARPLSPGSGAVRRGRCTWGPPPRGEG